MISFSRAVQSERETAEQITRDTCHADPSGSLTAVSTERCQCLSGSPMSTYEHTAVGGAYCGTLIGIKYGTDTGYYFSMPEYGIRVRYPGTKGRSTSEQL